MNNFQMHTVPNKGNVNLYLLASISKFCFCCLLFVNKLVIGECKKLNVENMSLEKEWLEF